VGNVRFIDATGIMATEQMITDFKRHGAIVLLVELRPNVREAPVQAQLYQRVAI
jgi:anti-anti-sigma regulatory factor